jgi:RNA-directed DNA polymerase
MKPIEELQNSLYLAAKNDKSRKFHSLKDKLYDMTLLRAAWKRVKQNRGTSGVDNETIEDIEKRGVDEFLSQLQLKLHQETYVVQCVRRVFIPKPNGEMRPLGIPTVEDRVVQQAVNLLIQPIFEADFKDFSFGYRPHRSARDASMAIYKWLNFNLTTVIDVDIKGFFENVNHEKLISFLMERVADGYIIKLIREWLRAGVVNLDENEITYPTQGTPQGGPISPTLANIYLNCLDQWVTELGIVNDSTKIVRYADDIVILTNRTIVDASHIKDVFSGLLSELDLELSEEKSRITAAKDGFDFLGFHFNREFNRRRGKHVTYFRPSSDSVASFKDKVREIIPVTRTHISSETEAVEMLNKLIVGWSNYFNHSHALYTYIHLQRFIEWKIAKFYSIKHKLSWTPMKSSFFLWLYHALGLRKLAGNISYIRT